MMASWKQVCIYILFLFQVKLSFQKKCSCYFYGEIKKIKYSCKNERTRGVDNTLGYGRPPCLNKAFFLNAGTGINSCSVLMILKHKKILEKMQGTNQP